MILMAFVPMASALSMKSMYLDGVADSYGVESSGNSATRADMIELQKDLAEERSQFKFQTKLLKDIVDEVDELKADYRSFKLPAMTKEKVKGEKHAEFVTEQAENAQKEAPEAESVQAATPLSVTLIEMGQGALKLIRKKEEKGTIGGAISHAVRVLMQIFFGVMYFLLIVRYYPQLPPNARPPQQAVDIQKMNPIVATFNVSPKIFLCSYMCPGPRAAHTYESSGIMNYWMGLICMSCFPCCTLFLANTVTDLNPRLGGDQMSFVGGCLASFFCSCCLIAQDAQALDYVSGVDTHFFTLMRP